MSADVHSPANAGPAEGESLPTYEAPEPAPPAPPVPAPVPSPRQEPEPPSPLSRPEVLAGGAFAGGFLAAILLRRLAG